MDYLDLSPLWNLVILLSSQFTDEGVELWSCYVPQITSTYSVAGLEFESLIVRYLALNLALSYDTQAEFFN